MNKLLLLKGESQVGKGTLTRIGLSIWNINNPIYFKTGGTFKSEYRLGEFSDKTTFPFVADECKGLFDEVRFVEILKNLRTEITARERADKRFLGLSSFCGSMNGELPINIDDGLLNGLLLVNFTMDEKNTETEQDEFTNFYNKNNKKLGYIGGFLSNEITKNWKEYKPIILKFDQLEAGRELFKMLLEKAKIEKPEWIEEEFDLTEFNPESNTEFYFYSTVLDDLNYQASRLRLKETIDDREISIDVSQKSLDEKIVLLRVNNHLPDYLKITKTNTAYFHRDVINKIKKKHGYEIIGSLENLAKRLGVKTESIKFHSRNERVMLMNVGELIKNLTKGVEK